MGDSSPDHFKHSFKASGPILDQSPEIRSNRKYDPKFEDSKVTGMVFNPCPIKKDS